MTPPQTPSELDKAVERLSSELSLQLEIPNDNHPTLGSDIAIVINAAKRLKEVEKERDELQFLLDNANEAISLKSPGFEGSSAFVRLFKQQEKELSTLRTEYKNALEALQCFLGDEEIEKEIAKAREVLSTPHAIAAMKKGEV